MPYIVPKFVYNDGSGHVTFTPTYAPVDKEPVDELHSLRTDSITSDGTNHQVVIDRIDMMQTLHFPAVPQSDLAGWQAFMLWALQGGVFAYHPDSTSSANNEYICTDDSWVPKRAFFNTFAFDLHMRRVKPDTSGS